MIPFMQILPRQGLHFQKRRETHAETRRSHGRSISDGRGEGEPAEGDEGTVGTCFFLSETVLEADGSGLVIVEGSYSHHPLLRDYYDLKLFLHVQPQRQLERIAKRNPAKLEDFKTKWIPFEELYFSNYDVMNKADLVIETTNLF